MKLEAFIIHLQRAEGRRAQVSELFRQIAPLPVEILDAVDGMSLTREEIEHVYRPELLKPLYPFALRPAEIACFLSHRKAWRQIVDRGLDAALVLEDDISIDPVIFGNALRLAQSRCDGSSATMIQFGLRPPRGRGTVIASDGETRIVCPQTVMLGAQAQLVSREAAKRLLASSEIFDRPVDVLFQMFWLTGVHPLAAVPSGVFSRSAKVGGTTIHAPKPLLERVYREWQRYRFRSQTRKLSRLRGGAGETDKAA